MKFLKSIIAVLIIAILAAVAFYMNRHSESVPTGFAASNGRLELQRMDLASLYPGRVEQILVAEGDTIKKGQTLLQLSSDQSKSHVAQAQAGEQRAQEAVSRAQAEVQARDQQLKVAQLELRNAQALRKQNLISSTEVNRRLAARDAANAAVKAARAASAEAQAAVAQSRAMIDAATSADNDMLISAPIDGRVEYKIATVGNVIGAGSRVITIVDPTDVYMNLFLPTDSMAKIALNQEARIRLDGLDAVWPAKVNFIAAQAQFTPKYVETASEREKLMYKVKVQVPVEVAGEYQRILKGGLTGVAYVRLDPQQDWPSDWVIKLPELKQ